MSNSFKITQILTILLLVNKLVRSANRIAMMSKVSNNNVESTHTLHHSRVNSLIQCTRLCLDDVDCKTITYGDSSKMCDTFTNKDEFPKVILSFPQNLHVHQFLPFHDCTDVQQRVSGFGNGNGIYKFRTRSSSNEFVTYCDIDNDGNAWTVFQRRQDGAVDFYRSWLKYTEGFGHPTSEFWLGNNVIHEITSSARYELRIDMIDKNNAYNVTYEKFIIGSEADNFRLDLGQYVETKSNVVDAMYDTHQGMEFSTPDRDNDNSSGNCGAFWGSWWFNSCLNCNLNGYFNSGGFVWDYHGIKLKLQFSEMKLRRIN